ncbi:hypothetical protein DYY67_1649 [Candidatus Nitrosotalea sp. TS]|nr:hypothetical protein [Candidatus Nitrosotalea sp. TS]
MDIFVIDPPLTNPILFYQSNHKKTSKIQKIQGAIFSYFFLFIQNGIHSILYTMENTGQH